MAVLHAVGEDVLANKISYDAGAKASLRTACRRLLVRLREFPISNSSARQVAISASTRAIMTACSASGGRGIAKALISPTLTWGEHPPSVDSFAIFVTCGEFSISSRKAAVVGWCGRKSIIRWPRQIFSPGGIRHAIPRMLPSRLYRTSLGWGTRRSTRSL